jgi:hypothetical protein
MRDKTMAIDIATRKFKALSYKQYDENNILNIVVYENKELIYISNCYAVAYFELPSGKTHKINCEIKNNTIEIILSKKVLMEEGKVIVEVSMTNEFQTVTTFSFYLNVEDSIDKAKISSDTNDEHSHDIYQEKIDTRLKTKSKEVVGSINELNEKINNLDINVDMSDYYNKEQVDEKIRNINNGGNVNIDFNENDEELLITSSAENGVIYDSSNEELIIGGGN